MSVSYDVEAVRAQFPALRAGAAHFDGPGGSQTPEAVADAIHDTLISPLANRGRLTAASRLADEIVLAARRRMAELVGGDPGGIVFGRSMTALTFDLARTLAQDWGPGDEVVVTTLDHDANIRPWEYAADAAGATLRRADFDPNTGELTADHVAAELSESTRLVAVTGASNLIGTRPDLAAIAEKVHAAGALFFVDGVHLSAHAPVDRVALGADFYACSPYKFLGPHCGVLAADPALLAGLHPQKLLPASDSVPERFEAGTLPYELLAGTSAAIGFLADLGGTDGSGRERLLAGMAAVQAHEDALREHLESGLTEIPGVTNRSRAARRTPTLLLTFADRDAASVAQRLAAVGINAPAGSFYALEASQRMGLGTAGGLRIGLAPYTNSADIDRLLGALADVLTGRPEPAA